MQGVMEKVLEDIYYPFCKSIGTLPDSPTFKVVLKDRELHYIFWTYRRRYEFEGSLLATRKDLQCFIDIHSLLKKKFMLEFAVFNHHRGQQEYSQGIHDRSTYKFSDLLYDYFRFLVSGYRRGLFVDSCIVRQLASTVARAHMRRLSNRLSG